MGELRVDPTAVQASGAELRTIADNLRSEFSAADEQIGAAHAGWVGQSAQALAAKAAQWREVTQRHHSDLTDHAEKFVNAARMYSKHDDAAADQLKQTMGGDGAGG